MMTWAGSLEEAEAARAAGAPVGPVVPPPQPQVPPLPRTLTREDLLRPEVAPLGSSAETEAVKEFVTGRFMDAMFRHGGARHAHAGALVRLFMTAKLGRDVPVALRNMAMTGNDVYYRDDGGEVTRCSRGAMAKALLPMLLGQMCEVIEELYLVLDSEGAEYRLVERLSNELFDPFRGSPMSIREAAEAYANDDREQLKVAGHALATFVRQERWRLSEMLARLPKFSCRGM